MFVVLAMYLGWYLIADAGAFNIDITNPIILRSPSESHRARSTYFGFSLDFHWSPNDSAPW